MLNMVALSVTNTVMCLVVDFQTRELILEDHHVCDLRPLMLRKMIVMIVDQKDLTDFP